MVSKSLRKKTFLLGVIVAGVVFVTSNLITDYFLFRNQMQKMALEMAHDKADSIEKHLQSYLERVASITSSLSELLADSSDFRESESIFDNFSNSVILSNPEIRRIQWIRVSERRVIQITPAGIGMQRFSPERVNKAMAEESSTFLAQATQRYPGEIWFAQTNLFDLNAITTVYSKSGLDAILLFTVDTDLLVHSVAQDSLYRVLLIDSNGKILYHNSGEDDAGLPIIDTDVIGLIRENTTDTLAPSNDIKTQSYYFRKLALPNDQEIYMFLSLNAFYSNVQKESFFKGILANSLLGFGLILVIYYLFCNSIGITRMSRRNKTIPLMSCTELIIRYPIYCKRTNSFSILLLMECIFLMRKET
ncbi:hypothetical protein ATY35_02165 [Vibrio cidicii]|uniref:Cache domain-containing protein n=1 Tax=Vibrio cidicii TaxID=1763883 RepID=A0ABR5W713_9VIBR|nr:hypothetical protein ATY35_02165 [Vibrio cidicii]